MGNNSLTRNPWPSSRLCPHVISCSFKVIFERLTSEITKILLAFIFPSRNNRMKPCWAGLKDYLVSKIKQDFMKLDLHKLKFKGANARLTGNIRNKKSLLNQKIVELERTFQVTFFNYLLFTHRNWDKEAVRDVHKSQSVCDFSRQVVFSMWFRKP